jgi:pentatricopeptide repeat protein
MSACAVRGNWDLALQYFSTMRQYKIAPDATTFSLLLSAADYAGKVDEVLHIYHSMHQKYQIIPDMKHSTIVVATLSRYGRLQEAINFITNYIPVPGISK